MRICIDAGDKQPPNAKSYLRVLRQVPGPYSYSMYLCEARRCGYLHVQMLVAGTSKALECSKQGQVQAQLGPRGARATWNSVEPDIPITQPTPSQLSRHQPGCRPPSPPSPTHRRCHLFRLSRYAPNPRRTAPGWPASTRGASSLAPPTKHQLLLTPDSQAARSSAAKMSGEAWLYLFAVLINAVNLFLQVFFTIMYSDLEWYAFFYSCLLCPAAARWLHQLATRTRNTRMLAILKQNAGIIR